MGGLGFALGSRRGRGELWWSRKSRLWVWVRKPDRNGSRDGLLSFPLDQALPVIEPILVALQPEHSAGALPLV